MSKTAEIYGINGPVIYLKGNTGFKSILFLEWRPVLS